MLGDLVAPATLLTQEATRAAARRGRRALQFGCRIYINLAKANGSLTQISITSKTKGRNAVQPNTVCLTLAFGDNATAADGPAFDVAYGNRVETTAYKDKAILPTFIS